MVDILKMFDHKTVEFVIFMVIPAVVYLVFVVVTFRSSDGGLTNRENDHWIELANANHDQAIRDGEGEDGEQPGPVRIEMLSNGMMVKRGGKPKAAPESPAKL